MDIEFNKNEDAMRQLIAKLNKKLDQIHQNPHGSTLLTYPPYMLHTAVDWVVSYLFL